MKIKLLLLCLLASSCLAFAACDNGGAENPQNNIENPDDGDKDDPKTTDPGVVINGMTWATRNVGAPGTFADTPQDTGMYYRWGYKVGWSATDPMVASDGNSTWPNEFSYDYDWLAENDPSPTGWRVPTPEEIEKMLDPNNVVVLWSESPAGYLFTDIKTNNELFLPAAGYRNNETGALTNDQTTGTYWGAWAKEDKPDAAYYLYFESYNPSSIIVYNHVFKAYGMPVRPIKAE